MLFGLNSWVIKFISIFLNRLKLFTPLDGVLTITLFIWLYYSKSNDQRRMSAEGKEKRSVCEKEVLSWKSQELVKIVQKSFFCPCTTWFVDCQLCQHLSFLPLNLWISSDSNLGLRFESGIVVLEKKGRKRIFIHIFFLLSSTLSKHHGKAYWIRTARKGTSSGTENLY